MPPNRRAGCKRVGDTAVQGLAAFADAALHVLTSAQRECALLSYELDPRLYGSEAFADAARQFVLAHERARLRVLINRSELARQGHRLVELARRVPSRVEIRQLLPERQRECRDDLLMADHHSLLHRREPQALEARLCLQSPLDVQPHRAEFQRWWDESPIAPDLRVLGL